MKLSKAVIAKTRKFVKRIYNNIELTHDWSHISFVVYHARYIAEKEGMNADIAEMGALLHDIGQEKMSIKDILAKDHAIVSARRARKFLLSQKLDADIIEHILDTIQYHSGNGIINARTPEAKAVYDADKLDAVWVGGFIRMILWDTRYEFPDAKMDFLYETSKKSWLNRKFRMHTKTGQMFYKKYFKQMKSFTKSYEDMRKTLSKI